ncbi:MAG: hypothetical protein HZB57_08185 [Gammaproteobacteria bacterium]|nr:hypothetical protein [Gammaproteobacteria bacterium]
MAAIKFPQLALGQGFIFRGTRYVKVSPLLARAEASGHSQVIPRSALVEPLDASAPSATTDPTHAALEELHRAALDCLEELSAKVPAPAYEQAHRQLAAAYQRALKMLN